MRWSLDHVAALVELAAGVASLIWGAFAFAAMPTLATAAFHAIVSAVFFAWGWRTWRAAAGPRPGARAPERSAGTSPPESLTPDEEREVARVVAVLAAEGVFAPRPPDPAQLVDSVADVGPPVTAFGVLIAVEEAVAAAPGVRAEDHQANLALHSSHTEQFAETVQAQAADLARLARGGLAGVTVAVEEGAAGGGRAVPVRLRVTADGAEQVIDYRGLGTYLSTVLHVTLARMQHERATGRRLAWLWSDEGAWLTGLAEGGVERLNAALGAAAGEGWEWIDEQEPVAAGDQAQPAEPDEH